MTLTDGLLDALKDDDFREKYYQTAQNNIFNRTIFTGIMDHEKLQKLIPAADLTVAPSIFPEAFGMVAVESLASGVLPLLTNHSGFKDIINIYKKELKQLQVLEKCQFELNKMRSLELDNQLIFNLSNNINLLLDLKDQLDISDKITLSQKAHEIAVNYFSWEQIAEKFLKL